MRHRYRISIHLCFVGFFLAITSVSLAQKTGLVLSGGGATGFAHIGVMKALEERGIPIDYITGTSAGALVGSMYAIGYSPAEIEAYVLSDLFQLMANGQVDRKREFLFQKEDWDASMIDLGFSKDSIFQKSLPTNFITPTLLDFEMMRLLGTASASVGGNFDQLFVPYRCVASDISNKKSVVFASGNLNECVRASMTYPFFVNPIRVNGTLLFDGGLYNNFPSDVMYHDFLPDFIIGSNVSGNAAPPTEDNLISQLTNMLMYQSNYSIPCDVSLMIEPKTDVSTFQFDEVKRAIDAGYQETIRLLDSLTFSFERRISPEELNARRMAFRAKIQPLTIAAIHTSNNKGTDVSFVRKSILRNAQKTTLGEELFTKRYFRTASAPQIAYLYPTLALRNDSTYTLNLHVRKSKDFKLEVGGHFSSRPINMGYIGLSYYHLGKTAYKVKAESYFGKFYGSARISADWQVPMYYPVSISPYFTLNRWDYFRSSATFFEDVKPSFLIQNELYYGVEAKHPIGNTAISKWDLRWFELEDRYYQTSNFLSTDTADLTRFSGNVISWKIEQNSLNRKQFANTGSFYQFQARLVNGRETSISGSTSPAKYTFFNNHQWINVQAEVQHFFINSPAFHLGVHGRATFNSQSLFRNYTATLLAMTGFAPIPDMLTLFQAPYRAPQHVGLGANTIFTIRKNLDIRFDGYIYQAFKEVIQNQDGTIQYSAEFPKQHVFASGSIIYHSLFGPLRFTTNYFPIFNGDLQREISFQVSFGYLLFHERAIR